jgi:hypothetical protein
MYPFACIFNALSVHICDHVDVGNDQYDWDFVLDSTFCIGHTILAGHIVKQDKTFCPIYLLNT